MNAQPVIHTFPASQTPAPGSVALCGFVEKDTRNYTEGPVCDACEDAEIVPDAATAHVLNSLASASADLQASIQSAQKDLVNYAQSAGRVNVYAPRFAKVSEDGAAVDAFLLVVPATAATQNQIRLARSATHRDQPYFRTLQHG